MTMRGLKIEPNKTISEIEDIHKDQKGRIYYGCILAGDRLIPMVNQTDYNLTMLIPDLYTDSDEYNPIATLFYNNLRAIVGVQDQPIYGTIYITNENSHEIIPFTREDFKEVLATAFKITPEMRTKYIKKMKKLEKRFHWVSELVGIQT